ncbi:MAG: hypothetical protein K9J12_09465 [Melioribacteraceae bacterium]|nr:hypothetical protein [Melioribacteraceae bacterium]MCF8264409.1 hypothetical protein [Melioribacteraceae bacterium]MCF8432093.1 hypothetical protein [Melioribacteraceae bacterium]
MKKVLSIILLCSLVGTLYSGVLLSFFHARSDGSNIILEWQTSQEEAIKEFVVERSASDNPFVEVDEIVPKGNDSFYSFTDKSAYKTADVLYTYRLKIVDMDNSISYSSEISVAHNVSSVKRTWGSIKALFR